MYLGSSSSNSYHNRYIHIVVLYQRFYNKQVSEIRRDGTHPMEPCNILGWMVGEFIPLLRTWPRGIT